MVRTTGEARPDLSRSESPPSLNLGFPIQHLREVANNVGPLPVHLGQDVKDEGLHVEVQGLVVQEKLGQQTQVLTVNLRGGGKVEAGSGSRRRLPPTPNFSEAWTVAVTLLRKCQPSESSQCHAREKWAPPQNSSLRGRSLAVTSEGRGN